MNRTFSNIRFALSHTIPAAISASVISVALAASVAYASTTISTSITTGGNLNVAGTTTILGNLYVSGTSTAIAAINPGAISPILFTPTENPGVSTEPGISEYITYGSSTSGFGGNVYTGHEILTNSEIGGGFDQVYGLDVSIAGDDTGTSNDYSDINIGDVDGLSGSNLDGYAGIRIDDVPIFGGTNLTNAYGINMYDGPAQSLGGTLQNDYGIYLANVNAGSVSNYAIYSAGGNSYFGGKIGIGTTTPDASLQVATTTANATTTVDLGKAGQTKGTCLIMYDATGAKKYVSIQSGAFVISSTQCN
jgi:hypothetical protein